MTSTKNQCWIRPIVEAIKKSHCPGQLVKIACLRISGNGRTSLKLRSSTGWNISMRINSWRIGIRILRSRGKSFKSYLPTNRTKLPNSGRRRSKYIGKPPKKWWVGHPPGHHAQDYDTRLCLATRTTMTHQECTICRVGKRNQAGCLSLPGTFRNISPFPVRRRQNRERRAFLHFQPSWRSTP